MARPLRIKLPDAFYHVTARGNERKDLFKRSKDREKFLGDLVDATPTLALLFFCGLAFVPFLGYIPHHTQNFPDHRSDHETLFPPA